MSSVKFSDHLLTNEVGLEPDDRETSVSARVDQCIGAFALLQQESPKLPPINDLNATELARGLTLEPKTLLVTPAQLPSVQPASLYLHGPFGAVLCRGASFVTGTYRFLIGVSNHLPDNDELKALGLLCTPSALHSSVNSCEINGAFSMTSFWSELPSPSEADLADNSYCLMSPKACHPAGVLLLLGSFYETFALSCLFVSMLRSMLRPRSHLLQPARRQKRKVPRQQRGKHPGDTEAPVPISGQKLEHLTKGLDSLGLRLLALVDDLVQAATSLVNVSEAWAQWAENHAVTDCLRLASTVCTAILPSDILQQFPILVPDTKTTLFTEVAGSYEKSFSRLAAGLRLKVASLHRMRNELRVYDDCATKLAACDLHDIDES